MFNFEPEFIKKLIENDPICFNSFYVKTVDIFFRYIKSRYDVTDSDAQDMLSDFYCKFRQFANKSKSLQTFNAFVRSMLRNVCIDFLKKRDELYFSDFDSSDDDFSDTMVDNISDENSDVMLEFNEKFKYESLESVISNLDGESKDILHFRYVENYSHQEIANILGDSIDNVRQKLSRTIKKLKQQLSYLE